MQQAAKKIIVIAGPTASGKSGLAMGLAKRMGSEIINADSVQVYKDLRILTARPSETEMEGIPHHLYGHLAADVRYSVGAWLKDAASVIKNIKLPIVVGGTGLYINAMVKGIAEIPPVEAEVERKANKEFEALGVDEFYQKLASVDKLAAEKVERNNKVRLIRAWCVFESTGKSLFEWQQEKPYHPFAEFDFKILILEPERQWLYQRCDARFVQMVEEGAVEEVARCQMPDASKNYENLPLAKALGFKEIRGYLTGHWSLATGIYEAQKSTRNYAKRQLTWFRHQLDGHHLDPTAISHSHLIEQILSSTKN